VHINHPEPMRDSLFQVFPKWKMNRRLTYLSLRHWKNNLLDKRKCRFLQWHQSPSDIVGCAQGWMDVQSLLGGSLRWLESDSLSQLRKNGELTLFLQSSLWIHINAPGAVGYSWLAMKRNISGISYLGDQRRLSWPAPWSRSRRSRKKLVVLFMLCRSESFAINRVTWATTATCVTFRESLFCLLVESERGRRRILCRDFKVE
jgi:hypothetical protein